MHTRKLCYYGAYLSFSVLFVNGFPIIFRLVCSALYNDADADRKYLPQFFKFIVANPLSVRTKVSAFHLPHPGLQNFFMYFQVCDLSSYVHVFCGAGS